MEGGKREGGGLEVGGERLEGVRGGEGMIVFIIDSIS